LSVRFVSQSNYEYRSVPISLPIEPDEEQYYEETIELNAIDNNTEYIVDPDDCWITDDEDDENEEVNEEVDEVENTQQIINLFEMLY
jgi:hypothetical protein